MSTGIYNRYTGYHNRKSIRLPGYDYSQPGYYFVTVCVYDWKQKLFGDVVDGKMILNELGECAQQCWCEIPAHFPHATLDEFIVMPNHVHGIIGISYVNVGANNYSPLLVPGQQPCIHTCPIGPLHHPRGTSKTIGSIIRGFKIGVTKIVRAKIPGMVVWQRNYYEHIIRNEKSLFLIRKYIRENPIIWGNDCENHLISEIQDLENE